MDWICNNKILTPKKYSSGDSRVKPVELLVVHYTAGPSRPMNPAIQSWCDGPSQSSTHLVISRNPAKEPTVQLASLRDRTWHAGGSTWRNKGNVNVKSIGLDMDNVGWLRKVSGTVRDSYGNVYRGPTPFVDAKGMLWEPYTDESIKELLKVITMLIDQFPILRAEEDRIIGHQNIMSTKTDPGPCFPWELVRKVVKGE